MDQKQAPHNANKDFFCIEVRTSDSGKGNIYFHVLVNKKSRAEKGSLIATLPAVKSFLKTHPHGMKIRAAAEKDAVEIGFVTVVDREHNERRAFTISEFYPLGETFAKKASYLPEILRGARLGTLIETQIAKYLKNRYPHSQIQNITALTSPRTDMLKKHLGISTPTKFLETKEYHARLKAMLSKSADKARRR